MEYLVSKSLLKMASACTLGIVLCMGTTPASADTYPGLDTVTCMADAWEMKTGKNLPHDSINCTANDVEITRVIPLDANGKRPGEEGYEPVQCTSGELFELNADITVRTNANERFDTTFYLPLTDQSPQDIQLEILTSGLSFPDEYCSMLLPIPNDECNPLLGDPPCDLTNPANGEVADVDLDFDECGDIAKHPIEDNSIPPVDVPGSDEYTLYDETISMICLPSPDDPNRAEFTYCGAWANDGSIDDPPKNYHDCFASYDFAAGEFAGQTPSQKSKCKCDSFPFDVWIRPEPPEITKAIVGLTTRPEPGGLFEFSFAFTNNSQASLFVTGVFDEVRIGNEGDDTYDRQIDLWGALQLPGEADDVYLVDSSCQYSVATEDLPYAAIGEKYYEVLPGNPYGCQFTVHILDNLIRPLSPEPYDDVIRVVLKDERGDPVIDGDTCPAELNPVAVAGEHCSNMKTVTVTDVPPEIQVIKTPSLSTASKPVEVTKIFVSEPGELVTFWVTVDNNSTVEDLIVDGLTDWIDTTETGRDIQPTNCASLPWTIAKQDSYSCYFQDFVGGQAGYLEQDTVTATGHDDELNEVTDTDPAQVEIRDDTTPITMIKTPNPIEFYEPDEDILYTYRINNPSSHDWVTINTLEEYIERDLAPVDGTYVAEGDLYYLTGSVDCWYDSTPATFFGLPADIAPLGYLNCKVTQNVTGNAGDRVKNTATARGVTDDGAAVSAEAYAEVDVLNVDPEASVLKTVTSMLVTYQVTVCNEKSAETLKLTELLDDVYGNLHGQGDCSVPQTLQLAGETGDCYTCVFEAETFTPETTDTVTAWAEDDEVPANQVKPFASATVTFDPPTTP